MRGQLRGRNGPRGRYAVLVEERGYVVFELLGGIEPELGDWISGIAHTFGGQTVHNETQDRSHRIYVEFLDATKDITQGWLYPR